MRGSAEHSSDAGETDAWNRSERDVVQNFAVRRRHNPNARTYQRGEIRDASSEQVVRRYGNERERKETRGFSNGKVSGAGARP